MKCWVLVNRQQKPLKISAVKSRLPSGRTLKFADLLEWDFTPTPALGAILTKATGDTAGAGGRKLSHLNSAPRSRSRYLDGVAPHKFDESNQFFCRAGIGRSEYQTAAKSKMRGQTESIEFGARNVFGTGQPWFQLLTEVHDRERSK